MRLQMIPLLFLTISVSGATAVSNSPHSPYAQLRTLMEDVKSLKSVQEATWQQSLEKLNAFATTIASLTHEIDSLKADKVAADSRLQEELGKKEEARNQMFAELKASLTHEIDSLKADKVAADSRLQEELGKKEEARNQMFAELKASLTHEIDSLKADKVAADSRLQEKLGKKEEACNQMFEDMKVESEKMKLAFEKDKALLMGLVEKMKEENTLLKKQFASLQFQTQTSDRVFKQIKSDIALLKSENEALRRSKSELEASLKLSYEKLVEKTQSLERSLANLPSAGFSGDSEKNLQQLRDEIIQKCKAMCISTLNQTNDRLQSFAKQVQENLEHIYQRD